jgi:hypothetical protein
MLSQILCVSGLGSLYAGKATQVIYSASSVAEKIENTRFTAWLELQYDSV